MAFSASALVQAVKDNSAILMLSGIGIIVAVVMLVLIGIFGGLVSDGTISVPSGVNTTIQALVTTAGTIMTTAVGVFSTLISFVVIVALLKAFGINISLGGTKNM